MAKYDILSMLKRFHSRLRGEKMTCKAKYSAIDIAKWFLLQNRIKMNIEDSDYITNLKLQKLLYYAQGCFLALRDKPLFPECLLAWTHGPVVREVYDVYKQYGSHGIPDDNIDFDMDSIDEDTQGILRQVFDAFGQYSAWKLREMSHDDAPWKNTIPGDVIPTGEIKEFFKENYIES